MRLACDDEASTAPRAPTNPLALGEAAMMSVLACPCMRRSNCQQSSHHLHADERPLVLLGEVEVAAGKVQLRLRADRSEKVCTRAMTTVAA